MWTLCFLFSFFLSSGSIVSWGQAQRLGRRENEVRQVVEEENKRGGWKEDRRGRWEDTTGEGWKADSGFLYEAGSVCFICLQLISASVTLSVYLRTFITCANSTHRERQREREWAQRWPKHISRGNLLHPGGVYAAKSINFQLFFFFFCPTQHAIKQESKRWRCLSDESERCTPLLFSSSPLHTSVLSLYPSTSPFLTVLVAFFLIIPTMGGFSAVSLKLVIKRQPLILQEERSKRRGIKMGERWSKWREDRKVGRKGKSGGRIYDFRQESGLMQQFPKSTTRDKVTWSLIFHLMYFEHLKNDYCICKLKGKTINTFK